MTSDFPLFAQAVRKKYDLMAKGELFSVDCPDIWETYLASFPPGTDPIFRQRTEHDCQCCKQFIRRVGAVVSLEHGSVWSDLGELPEPYATVAMRMNEAVLNARIRSVFRTKERQHGAAVTTTFYPDRPDETWNHFEARTARLHLSNNPSEDIGRSVENYNLLKRALEELSPTAVETVVDLIKEGALYRGAEFDKTVREFAATQRAYLAANDRERFLWEKSTDRTLMGVIRFRNSVIGTLVQDLSDNVDTERAVASYESKVAPQNYRRTTAIITKAMVQRATEAIRELGLESALERRHARLSDVNVNDVLWTSTSARAVMTGVEALLADAVRPKAPKAADRVPEIPVEKFVAEVLTGAKDVDLVLEPKHLSNFISITAPVHEEAGRLFRWNNGFAWAYDGDVADSIKERVKKAGGQVDAALRVSLSWDNTDDLDLHIAGGNATNASRQSYIYFGNRGAMGGLLDVDANGSDGIRDDPVENVHWRRMPKDGEYTVMVHQYNRRQTDRFGYELEVECDGELYQFSNSKSPALSKKDKCLSLIVRDGLLAEVKVLDARLKGGGREREKWGVKTGGPVPVETVMKSPNHWQGEGVGPAHWIFALRGCKNPEPVRGFFNEMLRPELTEHRKTFEILGSKTKCPPADAQLSGVGFTAARGDAVVVLVDNRPYKVRF